MTDLPERIKEVGITCFGQPAGILNQPGQYSFQYSQTSPHNCSLTMPIRAEPYYYGALHPVFAQNLPEGYVRRYISERLERYATVNDLYLLALQQNSGIGHIGVTSIIQPQEFEQITLDDILHWRGAEPIFAELLDRFYLRGMLSGVQPKVLVPLSERTTIAQSDVIVKTFDDEFEWLTINEFVCMTAAKAVGLSPPNFWLSDDNNSFVVERFDRTKEHVLAFEDFTVLMGKEKYRGSYETFLHAVADYTRSQDQVDLAYKMIVFNCLIGNGDAHLKNFAIQYDQQLKNVILTPPYDITHTLIYPTIDNRMALKMGGARAFPDKKTLIKLGKIHHVKHPEAIHQEVADRLNDFIEKFTHIGAITGLRQSLRKALAVGTRDSTAKFRRDRNKKYPN